MKKAVSTLKGKLKRKDPWKNLKTLLGKLNETVGQFGPLKSVIEGLVECIEAYENAAKGRKDYEALRSDLEATFGELQGHLTDSSPPVITACIDNICASVNEEIKHVKARQGSSLAGRPVVGAELDADDILACYRRMKGHLQRLSMNTGILALIAIEEIGTATRVKDLEPSLDACFNSASGASELMRGPCIEGTRIGVLQKIMSWVNASNVEAVLWMNGMAGTGKTTIAYSLCLELESHRSLGASFFCSRSLPKCKDAALILPSVAYQLAHFSHPYRSILSGVLKNNPRAHTIQFQQQFKELISDPLNDPKVRGSLPMNVVVVIDALDECENKEAVRQLLSIILEKSSGLPIKFMVSSRPEPEIRDKITEGSGDRYSQVILHELDHNEVQVDIMTYLRAELTEKPRNFKVSDANLTCLTRRAGTLFIYAATVVRYIGEDNFNQNPHSRLETIISMSGPSEPTQHEGIDKLYSAILGAAFNNPGLRRIDRENMRQVLHTVICAQEPLTIQALSGLLKLKSASFVYSALRPLWSVLHITGETELVTILHASFPDYLLDPTRAAPFYYCNAGAHHSTLVRYCFDSIANVPSFNICELKSSFLLDKEVKDIKNLIKDKISIQLRYSCQFWVDHLIAATKGAELKGKLQEFLSNRLLLWMEVMNLHRLSSVGAECMYRAKMWTIGHTPPESKDLQLLTHDAWRFTTTFAFHPVSQSTPHLYVSMLPFWPISSPIGKIYAARLQGAVGVRGTAMNLRQPALIAKRLAGGPVKSVAFSPGGTNVILAFARTIGVMDAFSRQFLKEVKYHKDEILCISLSRDGSRLVSSSRDKDICVWDTQDWHALFDPIRRPIHKGRAWSVIFSSNAEFIVSGSEDGVVCVWDAGTGDLKLGPLAGHSDFVTCLAISSDDARIFSGSKDKTIIIWNVQTGNQVSRLQAHRGYVTSIALSPNGSRLISGSADRSILIWDSQTYEKISVTPFIGHTDLIQCIAISSDGAYIASGSSDRSVLVWDAATGAIVLGPLPHKDLVYSVAFSPDDSRIVSGSRDGSCCFWDAQIPPITHNLMPGHKHTILSVDISPDGKRLLSGSYDRTIFMWDLKNGRKILGPLTEHRDQVTSVRFSPDGEGFASGSHDKTVRVWDIQTGKSVATFKGLANRVRAIAYSSDGFLIISGCDFDPAPKSSIPLVCLWDLRNSKKILGVLEGYKKPIVSVAFSPIGDRFVAAATGKEACVHVWDMPSNQHIFQISHTAGPIGSISFSPDGTRIACGAGNKTISIYDISTGLVLVGPLQGHTQAVNAVQYSADGGRIFSGSDDGTVCEWGAQDGKLIDRFSGHTGAVQSVAISPDGSRVASASNDMAIRVWNVQSLNLLPIIWALNKDGWVTVQSQRMVWVPSDLRSPLMHPRNATLLASNGYLELEFNGELLGESWTGCYRPV